MPPSASFAAVMKSVAPSAVPTSATIGMHPWPTVPAAAASLASSRPQIATCAPSAANATADASPRPDDAAATAARFPAIPRSISLP